MFRRAFRRLAATPLRAFVRTKESAELVPREIEMIDSRQKCLEALPFLMAERVIGLDSEGVGLGRWGRLCLLQISTKEKVFLFDPWRDGVVSALSPVLTNGRVVKVMHDCREDLSALYHQFGIVLDGVYDTQIAHFMLLEQNNYAPYQISLNDLLLKILGFGHSETQKQISERMGKDPKIWFYRPISKDLVEYAVQDVVHLDSLREMLSAELGDLSMQNVIHRSKTYTKYPFLNQHLQSTNDLQQKALRVQAMLVTANQQALYFKMNAGAVSGVVSRPESVARFKSIAVGDTVDCYVSSWNASGSIVFLERFNHERGTQPFAKPKIIPRHAWQKYGAMT
eukprot:gene336-448_t